MKRLLIAGIMGIIFINGGCEADDSSDSLANLLLMSGSSLRGIVSTFAGPLPGDTMSGHDDGIGNDATFYYPEGIASDGVNLFVAGSFNHMIRQIVIETAEVTTLAGSITSGYVDDTGTAARFKKPTGIATDGTNLYVCDTFNNRIRQIVIATGVVTTLAGSGTAGYVDGTGTAAQFNYPRGITTDGTNLYIADTLNHMIRRIVIATAAVTTVTGSTTSGDADGSSAVARFKGPRAIIASDEYLYVADYNNNKIRRVEISSGTVATVAGPAPGDDSSGDDDGTGTDARFYFPYGLATDGSHLYVCDSGNNKLRRIIFSSGKVTTVAGPAPGDDSSGDDDGTKTDARFDSPSGVTMVGTSLFITDWSNNKIRKVE